MISWQHDYETIREKKYAKRKSWADMTEAEFEGEKLYLAAMPPLTMCRQPSRSIKSLKNCMYHACAKYGLANFTSKVI